MMIHQLSSLITRSYHCLSVFRNSHQNNIEIWSGKQILQFPILLPVAVFTPASINFPLFEHAI
jgi:hypothetical protein